MGVDGYFAERGLSLEHLVEALAVEGDEVLLIAGSRSAGAMDDESDLELLLLTDERGFVRRADMFAPERQRRGERRRLGLIYARIAGLDVEVEVHLSATCEQLLDALDMLDPLSDDGVPGDGDHLGPMPRDVAAELMHRLHGGRALTSPEAFERMRQRVDLRKLASWNIHRALSRSSDALVDARQSLGRADPENAYLKLSAAYDALGDALLSSRGQPIDRWKWRLPRLRALGQPAFLERYLDVMLVRRGPSEPLGEFVARQLEAAQGVADALRSTASSEPGRA